MALISSSSVGSAARPGSTSGPDTNAAGLIVPDDVKVKRPANKARTPAKKSAPG